MPPSSVARAASLRVDSVRKQFGGVLALDDISLSVAVGECLALVGESGSGKTTLLRCVNRLIEPTAGQIYLGDVNVATVDPVGLRRGIGYVPQNGGLLPHWRVQRNVELVLRLTGADDAPERARDALRLVGLSPDLFASRWPSELSGGQRQRVAIARALANRPALLLLDEPFGALDAITRGELQDSFQALRTNVGATCVLVTHDLSEAMRLATTIAVMRAGRIEQIDTPAELLAAPATPYVRTLLERAHILDRGPAR